MSILILGSHEQSQLGDATCLLPERFALKQDRRSAFLAPGVPPPPPPPPPTPPPHLNPRGRPQKRGRQDQGLFKRCLRAGEKMEWWSRRNESLSVSAVINLTSICSSAA